MRVWWMAMMVVLTACSDKGDSGASTAGSDAVCEGADLSDPDCESGTAVIRIAVTADGAAAPSGTTVHVQACSGEDTTEAADSYGEARFNLPAATYRVWAENSDAGLASAPETHDIPGCGTTSLDIAMSAD